MKTKLKKVTALDGLYLPILIYVPPMIVGRRFLAVLDSTNAECIEFKNLKIAIIPQCPYNN